MAVKKILITSRSFGQMSGEPGKMLADAGFEAVYYNREFDEDEFCRRLADCDALIIGAHPLTEKALAGARRLKLVSKHGAGLDNIDPELMKKYGVEVRNVPAANANAVADLTLGLILDLGRKISYASSLVKQGRWERVIGVDIYGKNLTLVGFGEIGKSVAKRARGFSMKVSVYDPFLSSLPEEFSDVQMVSLEEGLASADFLSLHVPLTGATRNLIGEKEIALMKEGSFLINTSRGGIVNESALRSALTQGKLQGAALDVLEHEPVREDEPLSGFERVTITPHMGMYSLEAINAVSIGAVENVLRYFQ